MLHLLFVIVRWYLVVAASTMITTLIFAIIKIKDVVDNGRQLHPELIGKPFRGAFKFLQTMALASLAWPAFLWVVFTGSWKSSKARRTNSCQVIAPTVPVDQKDFAVDDDDNISPEQLASARERLKAKLDDKFITGAGVLPYKPSNPSTTMVP
jgi:hypothetical protein